MSVCRYSHDRAGQHGDSVWPMSSPQTGTRSSAGSALGRRARRSGCVTGIPDFSPAWNLMPAWRRHRICNGLFRMWRSCSSPCRADQKFQEDRNVTGRVIIWPALSRCRTRPGLSWRDFRRGHYPSNERKKCGALHPACDCGRKRSGSPPNVKARIVELTSEAVIARSPATCARSFVPINPAHEFIPMAAFMMIPNIFTPERPTVILNTPPSACPW